MVIFFLWLHLPFLSVLLERKGLIMLNKLIKVFGCLLPIIVFWLIVIYVFIVYYFGF